MLIGITGEMGSGKSTVARLLIKKIPGIILPFAKPLKDMARHMGWNGVKDEKGRRLLQLLGTEICRECIDDDYWIKKWQRVLQDIVPNLVIADDCRFLNEANAIKKNGLGTIIKVKGRRKGIAQTSYSDIYHRFKPKHRSESELKNINFDFEIDNSHSRIVLDSQIDKIYREITR